MNYFLKIMARPKTKSALINHESEAFGKRLAVLRKKAGYSQATFAEATGISSRMIAYYEAQGGRAPVDVLVKFADALGISTDKLLDRDATKAKKEKPKNQRLLKKFMQLETLPARDRESVLRIIDGLISKQQAS